jgi:hypothetical protein
LLEIASLLYAFFGCIPFYNIMEARIYLVSSLMKGISHTDFIWSSAILKKLARDKMVLFFFENIFSHFNKSRPIYDSLILNASIQGSLDTISFTISSTFIFLSTPSLLMLYCGLELLFSSSSWFNKDEL